MFGVQYIPKQSAYDGSITKYSIKNINHSSISDFFEETYDFFEGKTKFLLKTLKTFKINFRTENILIDISSDLEKEYEENVVKIMFDKIDDVQEYGSGWSLYEILNLDVYNFKYQCFNGSQYLKLPKSIESKKAIINVENRDDECFKWAILAALHSKEVKNNAQRVSKYIKYIL